MWIGEGCENGTIDLNYVDPVTGGDWQQNWGALNGPGVRVQAGDFFWFPVGVPHSAKDYEGVNHWVAMDPDFMTKNLLNSRPARTYPPQ